jgi:hypothetical protein
MTRDNERGRPRQESGPVNSTENDCTPDDHHRVWLAGYDKGLIDGQQAATEDMARALLHEQACVMTGIATRAAASKGPRWQAAVAEQAGEVRP